jgi:LysM repeat protein
VAAKAPPTIPAKSEVPAVVASSTRNDESKTAKTPPKAIAKEERKSDHAKPAENSAAKADTGKTYVVAKGDNPVAIAKKLKVPYDDLMAANHIDDPHKLQIGQKLIVPSKPTKPKKGD